MAIIKSTPNTKKQREALKVNLVPVAKDKQVFTERSNEVKKILTHMIVSATTRGRPRNEEEENHHAA